MCIRDSEYGAGLVVEERGIALQENARGLDGQRAVDVDLEAVVALSLIHIFPYNKNVGLKTKYTLAGEDVWRAAHVFWGRALAAAGGCTVTLAVFLPGVWSLVAALVLFALTAVSAAVYAGRYARRL